MEKVRYLLKQHVGGPDTPIVEEGQRVRRGELIAEPSGLGANIHASLNGTVISVNDKSIDIDADEEQNKDDYVHIPDSDDYLTDIKNAGIVGAGGAGFPTDVKLSNKITGGYLIANAAECEPLLCHNTEVEERYANQIVRGMKYMMEITDAKVGYIATKKIHHAALLALGKACKNEPNIKVKLLTNMYPAGDERVIVRQLLDIVLKPGELPIKANAIIQNTETIKRITEAIEDRKPFIDKDITLDGRIKEHSTVFENVPIGLPAKKFIDAAGGYISPHGDITVGGPFTGKTGTEETPVTKTTGAFLVAMPYPQAHKKIGLLECECGGQEPRLREIAEKMGSEVVAFRRCKRMVLVNGRYRCSLPGICPGQAEAVLGMKKEGAEAILTGTCQD
ncbi:proline reductase-associated electron transfer protein PrdC [Lactobacillus salsicarnum]|uniref:Proline reductase-associated electron transfer protein PrdC n=2 Tax=Companilactobacillus mishanensis TaxID=2486008 RepID=A0ABW9P6U1_9LACO|nr:proline reductase-associated electron transfer protein PrdC [Companilactobacillus mishanensis]MQS89468.1 proline reductase-associated electron transfer protein PrdC [Companilactobacillus mishanensis]